MIACIAVACAIAGCDRDGAAARADQRAAARESATGSAAPARAAAKRILVVGTSLTAGFGLDDPDRAYPADLARKIDSAGLNYEVVNAGVSGETSAGALRRMDWLLAQPVDVFVLETGANDGLRGLTVDAMKANIQAIIDRVRAAHPRAQILLIGMEAPPNLGRDYTRRFRTAFADLARTNRVSFLPFLLTGVAGVDSLNQADGIHPNARGAQIVADNVWTVLRPMLEHGGRA